MGHDLRTIDRVDYAAGLAELDRIGHTGRHTRDVILYALQRWARGEEEAAEKGATDRSFYGINLTAWRRVLAAARAAGEREPATAAPTVAATFPATMFGRCDTCPDPVRPTQTVRFAEGGAVAHAHHTDAALAALPPCPFCHTPGGSDCCR